jgi:hypothetical protein
VNSLISAVARVATIALALASCDKGGGIAGQGPSPDPAPAPPSAGATVEVVSDIDETRYTVTVGGDIRNASGEKVGAFDLATMTLEIGERRPISLAAPIEVSRTQITLSGLGAEEGTRFQIAEDGTLSLDSKRWGQARGFDGSKAAQWRLAAALVANAMIGGEHTGDSPDRAHDAGVPDPPPPPPPAARTQGD